MFVEKHGATYRIRDRVAGKKVTLEAGFATKKAAQNRVTALDADRLRGDFIDPRGGRVLLDDWLDLWWPGYEGTLKPSTVVSAAGLLRRYIRPMLGPAALDDIDRLAVQRWTADLRAGRTPYERPLAVKTVYNAHGMLHKILDEAVAQRLIRSNPAHRSGLPELEHKEMRFLTEPEAERLLAAVAPRHRALVLLLLFTGLRWAEAVGLRVGRVDVLERRLMITETMQELAETGEIVFVTPKSRRSRRTVTFPVRVADALIELVAGRERTEMVFVGAAGGVIRYNNFRQRVWLPALKQAGLQGLRLHDLRHTHVAWLISAGVPLTAISRRVGHASIMVTSDRYGHLLPEVDTGIMTALDGALDKIHRGGTMGATDSEQAGATGTSPEEPAGQAVLQAPDQAA
jgi:integrase